MEAAPVPSGAESGLRGVPLSGEILYLSWNTHTCGEVFAFQASLSLVFTPVEQGIEPTLKNGMPCAGRCLRQLQVTLVMLACRPGSLDESFFQARSSSGKWKVSGRIALSSLIVPYGEPTLPLNNLIE